MHQIDQALPRLAATPASRAARGAAITMKRITGRQILRRISEDCSAMVEMARAADNPFLAYVLSIAATEAARDDTEMENTSPPSGISRRAPQTVSRN
jgi:hypothetical protein